MPFQVSPGVNVSEIDLSTVVPAVSTTEGAIAGVFRWGPIGVPVLVDSEDKLAARFGKPNNDNAETFFSAANFLAYGNKLYVSRAANTTAFSNTVSLTLYGNTTINFNGTAAGITNNDIIVGTGIVDGTYIVKANTSQLVLSKNASLGSGGDPYTGTFMVFSEIGTFSAIANSMSLTVDGSGANTDRLARFTIKNQDEYVQKATDWPTGTSVEYVAKYPGAIGNSLKISICDSAQAFNSNVEMMNITEDTYTITDVSKISNAGLSIAVGSNIANIFISNTGGSPYETDSALGAESALDALIQDNFSVGDIIRIGNTTVGFQDLRVLSIGAADYSAGNTRAQITLAANYALSTNYYSNTVSRYWEYYSNVDKVPGTSTYVERFGNTSAKDEVHIVVADEDGRVTGVPGTILEVFESLSRAEDAKTEDGATLYYRTVINDGSNYVWNVRDRIDATTSPAIIINDSINKRPLTMSFNGGYDGGNESTIAVGALMAGYDVFRSAENIDVSLILQGKARGVNGTQLANYLIDNIAEYRKDCVVFVSPEREDVVNNIGKDEVDDVVAFRNNLTSTSYAVLDSGYKYQYDRYNDVYRWIPLNGDIAGLAVRTDNVRDPWWSPAGFNRGQIKNIIKLAFNPGKAERDILYKNDINPVVIFPGQGTVLYGDKTLLGKPSAFDRINVRRLFIVLEKAIATAAKFTLFEFNDEFTRAQFKNLVEPFLRDVQGRRGVYDFKVVCDETNNTSDVIDRNEFVGDIYIKPAKSINFIQLNFIAVRSGVEFSEIVGRF